MLQLISLLFHTVTLNIVQKYFTFLHDSVLLQLIFYQFLPSFFDHFVSVMLDHWSLAIFDTYCSLCCLPMIFCLQHLWASGIEVQQLFVLCIRESLLCCSVGWSLFWLPDFPSSTSPSLYARLVSIPAISPLRPHHYYCSLSSLSLKLVSCFDCHLV